MKFISKRKNGTLSAGCNWVSERTHRSQCREVIIPSCAMSYLLPTTWSCQTLSTCQWSVIISVSSGWFIIMLLVMFILVSRNITRRQTNSNALFAMISRSIDNWINLSFYFYASLISYFSMLIMKDTRACATERGYFAPAPNVKVNQLATAIWRPNLVSKRYKVWQTLTFAFIVCKTILNMKIITFT